MNHLQVLVKWEQLQQTDCSSYMYQQGQFYVEHIGLGPRKVLSKSWPKLLKSSQRMNTERADANSSMSSHNTLTFSEEEKSIKMNA